MRARRSRRPSAHDIISDCVGFAREQGAIKSAPTRGGRETYYDSCFGCGHKQPRSFRADGVLLKRLHFTKTPDDPNVDVQAPCCPNCGKPPNEYSSELVGLQVGSSFSAYWDIGPGPNDPLPPGCRYVRGKGVYVPTRQHLYDLARMTGGAVR